MALMEEELRDVSLPHRRSAPPLNIPYVKIKPCCGGSANNTVVEVIRAGAVWHRSIVNHALRHVISLQQVRTRGPLFGYNVGLPERGKPADDALSPKSRQAGKSDPPTPRRRDKSGLGPLQAPFSAMEVLSQGLRAEGQCQGFRKEGRGLQVSAGEMTERKEMDGRGECRARCGIHGIPMERGRSGGVSPACATQEYMET
ncbi:hypothetical protein K456DRAFT_40749 [Colletotrichum gloeosporioides 23]|nr:hypothetical protein K456DRAFT_40749 [Colletotrichum gloeosporioides 23]